MTAGRGVSVEVTDGPIRVAIIGAGNRGREVYGGWIRAHPDQARVVAVADPDPVRRGWMASDHGIEPAQVGRAGLGPNS